MHIIGTAGHVDHGKSALIAALTGTNPDRLIEEQLRGMTLDLGFAHLRFDDGIEGGIVDVPGHERFLHNMLAGAPGMEILLLVVDASEGARPQTLEHLQILHFLNIRRVVVAASKIDLVAQDERESAVARIRAQLDGTIAQDAPLYPVSAVTGENLERLKTALHDELAGLTPRDAAAPVYLPIDRVFVLAGLGTVVTGTLMQGRIEAGDTLVLEPGGLSAHVRSIGVFGSTRKFAEAGARVALSLPGIERSAIRRGQAIVGPEFSARQSFAVRFTPVPGAQALLRRRTPVRAYFGSAAILGTLVSDGKAPNPAGTSARLHLREPVVAFPGLRFVVRRPSPMTLLGGGYVEGYERAAPATVRSSGEDAVLAAVCGAELEPMPIEAIAIAANLRENVAHDIVERLVESGDVIRVPRPQAYLSAAVADHLAGRIEAELRNAHECEPWSMGLTSLALARLLDVPEPLLIRLAEHFVAQGRLVNRGGYFAAVDHRPALTPEQRTFFEFLVPLDEGHPLLPIQFAGGAAAVKASKIAGLSKAFETMLAHGALVKVGDDLYRGSQIAQIRARVEAHFRDDPRMTASQFRDLLGTSRKYGMPLLEWLDAHGVTIRDGDYRTLRKRREPA